MSKKNVFRRILCSTLKCERNRSVSCHAKITGNALNSRSTELALLNRSNGSVVKIFYHTARYWKPMGTALSPTANIFTLMSYNILAQQHIDSQPSLYRDHNPNALQWEHRFDALKREIDEISPDILCLQEVQQNHLKYIANHFNSSYDTTLFKKRTGLQVDGCAIFFKKRLFDLIEFHFLDYFQPEIKILNRCNVAIIAKFRLKSSINQQFVVSTTHLLFNPKRQDIRLAQMQVLLAELDRIACHTEQHRTVPIILTGDFNIQQNSDVFRLIVGESVVPRKLFEKMNFKVGNDRKNLLPREMGISDECQHLDVVVNSNRYQTTLHSGTQFATCDSKSKIVHKRVISAEEITNSGLPFDTGIIQHKLNLLPTIYIEKPFKINTEHASTFHNKWVMVDYIFFSETNQSTPLSSTLRLLENYQLPTISECNHTGAIPNFNIGSDHYSVAARFSIE